MGIGLVRESAADAAGADAASGPWQVPYEPAPSAAHLPVELLTFADLRAMDAAGRRRRAQRPSFHVLALVDSGTGEHRLDFVDEQLTPRTVVHVHPGAVHRWTDVDAVDGTLVLFTPAAADVDASSAEPSRTRQLDAVEWSLVTSAADHLRREYAHALHASETGSRVLSLAILRLTLRALVLRADGHLTTADATDRPSVFAAYRRAVEDHFADWRQVGEYATALGYAPRTLTRATRAATGVGAKRFLDQRVVLEAKRLLAHTDLTVAQCASTLGFSQPSNFAAFFTEIAGVLPSQWRTMERSAPHRQ